MPIVNTIHGDLVALAKEGRYTHIAHGCNCHGIMGSGIAPQIADAFDNVREADHDESEIPLHSKDRLGWLTLAESCEDNVPHVLNLYTQFNTAARKGELVVDYEAIRKVFSFIEEVFAEAVAEGTALPAKNLLGIPQIGAGLAGGDWDTIASIINEVTPTLPIELVIYKRG